MKSLICAAIASAFLFCTPSSASAGIILEVSDNGTDTTLQWSGSMDLTGSTNGALTGKDENRIFVLSSGAAPIVYSYEVNHYSANSAGTPSGQTPFLGGGNYQSAFTGGGSSFGFQNSTIYWDQSFGTNPGIVTPVRSWTIANETVASLFGSNLDAGPVLLWTHNGTGDTISLGLASAAVPEPSSASLIGLGLMCCFVRRRRRNEG